MTVIRGLEKLTPDFEHAAVAVGVFDGVHWGHRAIFERLVDVARESDIAPVALTFDKHPAELLVPEMAPPYITTLDQRIELIQASDVDRIIIVEFDLALAELSPEEFLRNVIRGTLRARHVVVGSNFQFGKGRKGNIRYLASAAPALGLGVSVVPSVIVAGAPVSSTRVRTLIARGDVADASKLLGRRFALRGTVVPGDRVGRSLGFPTANIQTAPRQLVPAHGVYAVEVRVSGSTYGGLCYIGTRPTFGGQKESVEVHLMGYQGDLYGSTLDVIFARRLRDDMVFESPDKLVEQIKRDLERVSGDG
jgi:riboflavin kinase/FMN adenylyltransferase